MRRYIDLSDEEREIAFDRIIGFRAPSDDRQFPSYGVAAGYRLAALAGLADQDLADRYVIDFLLLYVSDVGSEYRPPLEKAMGRPLAPDEIGPSDHRALQEEQQRRNKEREAEELFT